MNKPSSYQRRTRFVLRLLLPASVGVLSVVAASCRREPKTPPASRPVHQPPNLLLITIDTTRFDHLGCYGHAEIETPAMDRLATEGIRYARCYSPAPITLPTHASILTGVYPYHHHLHDNGEGPLDEKAVTLAEVARDNGYDTAAVVGAFVLHSDFGIAQGFDAYDDDFTVEAVPGKGHFAERDARAVTDIALKWLDRRSGTPYFLWVHYFDPHQPYEPPGIEPNTPRDRAYDMEIEFVDGQLARLLDRVRAIDEGTGRKTLTVFTADHGESLDDHGEPTHGLFVYNATIQVPLIVVLPDSSHRGTSVDTPVSLVDLYPSILDWLDLPKPYEVPGYVLPLANSHNARPRRPIYFETHIPLNMYGWSPLEGLLVGSAKFIAAPDPEFYELGADPGELDNVISSNADRAETFRLALAALKADTNTAPVLAKREHTHDEKSVRALRSLGYAGAPAAENASDTELPDPKDLVQLHALLCNIPRRAGTGATPQVLHALDRALDEDPHNLRALSHLIDLLKMPERNEAILTLAQEWVDTDLAAPYDLRLPIALAAALSARDDADQALAVLSHAADRHPDSIELLIAVGRAHLDAGRLDDAEQALQNALRLDPDSPLTKIALGDVADRGRRFDVAAKRYRDAMKDHEPVAAWHAKLGDALHDGRDARGAVREYRRAIELDGGLFDAHAGLAIALSDLGDTAGAVEAYRAAGEAEPGDVYTRYNLAVLLLQEERTAEAIEVLREVVRLDPKHGRAFVNLGIALHRTGQGTQAKRAFQSALAFDDTAAEAHLNLGIAYAREGRPEKTAEHYEQAIARKPDYEQPISELSGYYLANGRIADAVRVLRIGAEHLPKNVTLNNMLAQILASSRDDSIRNGEEAVRIANQACALTAHRHPTVLATLAAAHAEAGAFAKAVETIDKAIKLAGASNQPEVVKRLRSQRALYTKETAYRDPRF